MAIRTLEARTGGELPTQKAVTALVEAPFSGQVRPNVYVFKRRKVPATPFRLEGPKSQHLDGGGIQAGPHFPTVELFAVRAGAKALAGNDKTVEFIRLQERAEVPGFADILLTIGRRTAEGDLRRTELVITDGTAQEVTSSQTRYSEKPAGSRDSALARKVLLNVARLG